MLRVRLSLCLWFRSRFLMGCVSWFHTVCHWRHDTHPHQTSISSGICPKGSRIVISSLFLHAHVLCAFYVDVICVYYMYMYMCDVFSMRVCMCTSHFTSVHTCVRALCSACLCISATWNLHLFFVVCMCLVCACSFDKCLCDLHAFLSLCAQCL